MSRGSISIDDARLEAQLGLRSEALQRHYCRYGKEKRAFWRSKVEPMYLVTKLFDRWFFLN
jgi:hypothetical protein